MPKQSNTTERVSPEDRATLRKWLAHPFTDKESDGLRTSAGWIEILLDALESAEGILDLHARLCPMNDRNFWDAETTGEQA